MAVYVWGAFVHHISFHTLFFHTYTHTRACKLYSLCAPSSFCSLCRSSLCVCMCLSARFYARVCDVVAQTEPTDTHVRKRCVSSQYNAIVHTQTYTQSFHNRSCICMSPSSRARSTGKIQIYFFLGSCIYKSSIISNAFFRAHFIADDF